MSNTIRWITPRICYTEFADGFGNYFHDISYGVWDFPKSDVIYERLRELLLADAHKRHTKIPWFVEPTQEYDVEERHFLSLAKGKEEGLSIDRVPQFIRDFAHIWHWRPGIEALVLRDLVEFTKEDPKYRREFDRWYRVSKQGPYRRPHFYRDFLSNKVPIREDDLYE